MARSETLPMTSLTDICVGVAGQHGQKRPVSLQLASAPDPFQESHTKKGEGGGEKGKGLVTRHSLAISNHTVYLQMCHGN